MSVLSSRRGFLKGLAALFVAAPVAKLAADNWTAETPEVAAVPTEPSWPASNESVDLSGYSQVSGHERIQIDDPWYFLSEVFEHDGEEYCFSCYAKGPNRGIENIFLYDSSNTGYGSDSMSLDTGTFLGGGDTRLHVEFDETGEIEITSIDLTLLNHKLHGYIHTNSTNHLPMSESIWRLDPLFKAIRSIGDP